MDFAILGPLEVRRDGRVVPIVSRKQRLLLAALLNRPNEVVSVDLLIDALWGEDVPASASNAIQVHVSHLRRVLADGSAVTSTAIETRDPGYLIRVDAEALDATRFERLIDEGRRLGRSGASEAAARTLRAALDLWRGPAFADLAYEPFLQPVIARLDELRLGGIQDRIDADLALGGDQELIPELRELVRTFPLRERLRRQLMLALYRADRQADALEAARDARRVLADELGIDPGPELQRLETSILHHDPELTLLRPSSDARATAEPTPPSVPPSRADERRVISVLVVRGARTAPETDPEDVVAALLPVQNVVEREVAAFAGEVGYALGEALVVTFGARIEHGDEAERAIRAGLRVLETLGSAEPPLEVRAGIATGEALVSSPETAGPRRFAGDVVSAALREAEDGPIGRVVVDEPTYNATRRAVSYRELPRASGAADGRERGWVVRRIRSESVDREGPRGPFLGRDRELHLAASIWARVRAERTPHLITILGAPGIGKSRLAKEFSRTIARSGGRVVRGRSLPYGGGAGYGAFAQHVATIAGIRESDGPETARRKLAEAVGSALSDAEAEETTEHLALLIGLPTREVVADQQVLFYAARRLIEGVAAERPLLLVFEDIHWADASLLDLLESLAARVREAPVLLLALARPELLERRPGWSAAVRSATTLDLAPLSAADSVRLASHLASGEGADLIGALAERGEGNPLFIEELVAAAAERGDAVLEDLPGTVRTTIAARLDALPAPARSIALDASVVGRVFWRGALREPNGATLDQALEMLEDRDLVWREPTSRIEGDRQYIFKHMLIREVAYATLPRATRRARHAEAATFIERTSGDRIVESARPLAYHLREAGESRRAIDAYLMAAEHALRGWAKGEAVALLAEALELVPEDDLALRQLIELRQGYAYLADGDYRRASEVIEPLVAGLSGREEIEAYLALTKAAGWLTDAEGVRRYGRRAAELAEALGEPELSAPALGYISQISSMEGRPGEMIELGEKALAAWPSGHLPSELAYQLELVALTQTWVGHFDEADRNLREALALAEECHSVEAMLRSGATLGLALVGLGRHEEALDRFADTIARGRELELLPRFTARALNMSSSARRDLFELEAARLLNLEAIEFGHEAGFPLAWIQGGIDILEADLLEGELGRVEVAWPTLWEQTESTQGFHQWLMAGRLLVAKAQLAFALGDAAGAAVAAERALAHAEATERPKQRAAAGTTLGLACIALGQVEEGVDRLREASRVARGSSHPPTRWRADAALGRALVGLGRDADAQAALGRARSTVQGFAEGLDEQRRDAFLVRGAVADLLAGR